jgi:hypothetical protein
VVWGVAVGGYNRRGLLALEVVVVGEGLGVELGLIGAGRGLLPWFTNKLRSLYSIFVSVSISLVVSVKYWEAMASGY